MDKEITTTKESKKTVAAKLTKHDVGIVGYLYKLIREILAIAFWFYVLIKLFIFDIDIFIADKFLPEYTWLLKFKFFIIIGIVAIFWLVTKNKQVLIWFIYISFYPFIILFWKIPIFVFKQKSWIFAFALINAIISFFKSIKYNFITTTIFLISLTIIINSSNIKLLWLSISLIFIVLVIIYIRSFILVFKPSSIFQVHTKIFSGIRKHAAPSFSLDENIKNLPIEKLNEKQLEKWTTNLQTSVLFNRVCLFTSKKLRDYQNSGLNIVSYVLTLLLLIIFTIISFASINYGLYKINNELFSFVSTPSFFTFFYYSFNNLLFSSIREVTPVALISQAASMIESFFALFLVVIFVSLLLSVKNQKYTDELNKVIEEIEQEGKSMEVFIKDEYKLRSIEDAMVELEKLKAGLVKFIYKISKSIE